MVVGYSKCVLLGIYGLFFNEDPIKSTMVGYSKCVSLIMGHPLKIQYNSTVVGYSKHIPLVMH